MPLHQLTVKLSGICVVPNSLNRRNVTVGTNQRLLEQNLHIASARLLAKTGCTIGIRHGRSSSSPCTTSSHAVYHRTQQKSRAGQGVHDRCDTHIESLRAHRRMPRGIPATCSQINPSRVFQAVRTCHHVHKQPPQPL